MSAVRSELALLRCPPDRFCMCVGGRGEGGGGVNVCVCRWGEE